MAILYLVIIAYYADFTKGLLESLGLSNPIGTAYKFFMILALLLFIFNAPGKIQKITILSIFFVWSCLLGLWALTKEIPIPIWELIFLSKVLLPFLVFFAATPYLTHRDFSVNVIAKLATQLGILISISNIMCLMFGVGFYTYGTYAFGKSSFFISANGLSVAMLICLTFSLNQSFRLLKPKYFTYTFLLFIGTLTIGTRTSFAGSVIILFFYLFYYLFAYQSKTAKGVTLKSTTVLFFAGFVVGLTLFIYELTSKYEYMAMKLSKTLAGDFRGYLSSTTTDIVQSRSFWENLTGSGINIYTSDFRANNPAKAHFDGFLTTAEVDHLDILGSYGFFLGGIIIAFYILVFTLSLINLLKQLNNNSLCIFLICAICTGHAFFAGHIMYDPVSSLLYSFAWILIARHLFCSYHTSFTQPQKKH